jgi:hypothetical protein
MSGIAIPWRAPETYPLRQLLDVQGNSGRIVGWVCNLSEPIKKSESLKHRGVDSDAHRCIPSFYTVKSGSARERPVRHNGRRQAAPATSVTQVVPELLEIALYGRRGVVRCRHNVIYMFL